jgi:hypothetical protein
VLLLHDGGPEHHPQPSKQNKTKAKCCVYKIYNEYIYDNAMSCKSECRGWEYEGGIMKSRDLLPTEGEKSW